MNRRTETRADSLPPPLFCSDVKGAARSNRYPPHVDPLFRAARNHCSDQISGLEALDLFGPFGLGAGKTKLIDIAFLAATMPLRRNQQGDDTSQCECRRGTLAHTSGVNPVDFWQPPLRAVELRQPT